MSKNAVVKENIRSTAQGNVRSFLLSVKKGTNEIFLKLNKGRAKIGETKSEKWNRDLREEVTEENSYAYVYKTTPDPKIRRFQLRIFDRIIPTNKYLFMCKITDSALCTCCAIE